MRGWLLAIAAVGSCAADGGSACGPAPQGDAAPLLGGWYTVASPEGVGPLPPVGWGGLSMTALAAPVPGGRIAVVAQHFSLARGADAGRIAAALYGSEPVDVVPFPAIPGASELVFRAPGRARPAPDLERVLEITDAAPGEPVVTVIFLASRDVVAKDPAGCRATMEAWAKTLRRGAPPLRPVEAGACVPGPGAALRVDRPPDGGSWVVGPQRTGGPPALRRLKEAGGVPLQVEVWFEAPPRRPGDRPGPVLGAPGAWHETRYDDGLVAWTGTRPAGDAAVHVRIDGPPAAVPAAQAAVEAAVRVVPACP